MPANLTGVLALYDSEDLDGYRQYEQGRADGTDVTLHLDPTWCARCVIRVTAAWNAEASVGSGDLPDNFFQPYTLSVGAP